MDCFKAKLIGELVGLARATDGNEHLISARSTAVIRECLSAAPANAEEYRLLLSRVEEVKRAMVPDCFLCANPRGRTSAFDLKELEYLPGGERSVKRRILDALLNASGSTPESTLYRGLIALGMEGLSLDFLDSVAKEVTG